MRRPDRRRALALALAVCASVARARPARAGSVAEEVMARIAAARSARRADFVEEKRLRSVTVPLVSRGRLSFTPPGRLEKDTVAPAPERLVIDGDELTITGADGAEQHVGLDENQGLRLLADTLRAVLGGDLATLRRLYDLEEAGDTRAWRLLMVPRASPARHVLARVTVDGSGTDLRQIVLQQGNGDEQRLVIQPAS